MGNDPQVFNKGLIEQKQPAQEPAAGRSTGRAYGHRDPLELSRPHDHNPLAERQKPKQPKPSATATANELEEPIPVDDDGNPLEPTPFETAKKVKTQAYRIMQKFGGPMRFRRLLTEMGVSKNVLNAVTLYRWTYYGHNGATGVIPGRYLDLIMKVARYDGVVLTAEDFYPGIEP